MGDMTWKWKGDEFRIIVLWTLDSGLGGEDGGEEVRKSGKEVGKLGSREVFR